MKGGSSIRAGPWCPDLPMMSSPLRFSPWKRIVCIFFLPVTSSGFAPWTKNKEGITFENDELQLCKYRTSAASHLSSCLSPPFNWSHLTPLELKDRTVGLQTESSPYFTLEGHKFLIFGGSIHYFRVPREYWRDRLQKLKACGFNTVTTYVPWNLHEAQRGTFDFSGNLDLEAFVLMAAEMGLWVILRPGPYICSEIDLGGLPSWLLQDPRLKLRTTHPGFVEAVDKYFDHLIAIVVPLQYHQGGPIIAVQVENEYGSFNQDAEYMPYLQKKKEKWVRFDQFSLQALLERGIVEPLMTSDGVQELEQGRIEGVLATINVDSFEKKHFTDLIEMQENKPIMVMEYWVGWFDTWGDSHMVKDAKYVERTVSNFIKSKISFNVYMFHGGTNFGFINGAINFGTHKTIVTSYDYDAVLTEAGDYTEKYFKLRKLFGSVLAFPLPLLPELTPKAVYPSIRPSLYLPLWDVLQYLNEPVKSSKPLNMEKLPINNGSGQSYGFILYETSICSGGQLRTIVRDTAQVFLNETSIGTLHGGNQILQIPEVRECQLLRILVENQGRVNFSWKIQSQRKGLIRFVTVNNIPLEHFTIYSLEMKMSFFESLRLAAWRPVSKRYVGPAFYLGKLRALSWPRDTFLKLLNWNYGFVFINGRNLGRYWNIGPQKTLYLPGAWLHPGDNEIILFEVIKSGSHIKTTDKPKL